MSRELFARILAYLESLSLIRQMIETGLISQEEFQIVEARLAEKYHFSQRSILRELS